MVTDKTDSEGLGLLRQHVQVDEFVDWEDPKEIAARIADYDILIVRSRTKVTSELISAAANLKIIGRPGTGLDNVDLEAAKARGIKVLNTPEATVPNVAEMTIGLALALLRNISRADSSMKQGRWDKKLFRGNEIYARKWGIVGLGRIGIAVAQRLKGFECEVLAYDPFISREKAESLGIRLLSLEELVSGSDIISVHVPLTPDTKGLIGAKELASMKESAIIINISRGGIVDEAALYDELRSGGIKGAALDVFESEPPESSPLLGLDNVVLTPHLGAQTFEAQKRMARQLSEKIVAELQ